MKSESHVQLQSLSRQHCEEFLLAQVSSVCPHTSSSSSAWWIHHSASWFLHSSCFGNVSIPAQASLVLIPAHVFHHASVPSFSQPGTWAVLGSGSNSHPPPRPPSAVPHPGHHAPLLKVCNLTSKRCHCLFIVREYLPFTHFYVSCSYCSSIF